MQHTCSAPGSRLVASRCGASRTVALALAPPPAQHVQPPTSTWGLRASPQRRPVAAAARRGGGSGGGKRSKKSRRSEAEEFEQLMFDWDDAFAADCADAEKAALMARLAEEGHRQHGRGFVFVRSTLERRSRKAASGSGGGGKGFGAASQKQQADAGTSLSVNPQLLLQEWSAAYIPGAALGGTGGLFSAAGEGGSLSLLPDSGGLLAQETGVGGGGGQPLPPAAQGADAATAGAADAAALDELRRVLRGQDLSQLYGYIGLPPPGAPSGSASSEEHQQQGQEEGQEEQQEQHPAVGGIRAYEPEAGELVVLLAARIGGKPATGAELLVAVRQPDGSIALELPDGWEAALAGAA